MNTLGTYTLSSSDIDQASGGLQILTPSAFCHILGPHCIWYPIEIPGPFIPFTPVYVLN